MGWVGRLSPNRTRHSGFLVVGVLAPALLITSCDGGAPQSPASTSEAFHAYKVRGVVVEVTPKGLTIHHQAIDDYIGPEGQVVGMDPMAMRFHLSPELRADDFQVQDVLEFRFEDRSHGQGRVIVEAQKLPPGTALDFRAAHPRKHQ